MRPDVMTRQCNEDKEGVGAIGITKQMIKARSGHHDEKQKELERKQIMRKDNYLVTLWVIRDRMVLINNNEPLALFRESYRRFLELSVANVSSE
jgi:hypothetical protein